MAKDRVWGACDAGDFAMGSAGRGTSILCARILTPFLLVFVATRRSVVTSSILRPRPGEFPGIACNPWITRSSTRARLRRKGLLMSSVSGSGHSIATSSCTPKLVPERV